MRNRRRRCSRGVAVEVLDACINGGLEPDPTREALFAVAEGHPLDEAAESALQRERVRKRRVAEKNDRSRP